MFWCLLQRIVGEIAQMTVRPDCRFYNGYKPCGKREDCRDCPHYVPWSKQVLIVKLAATGDVVRTTAILPGLKKHYPACCITWITDEAALPLLRPIPLINRLYAFNADGLYAVGATEYDLLLNFEKEPKALGLVRAVEARVRKGFAPSASGTPVAADEDAEYALRLGLSDELKFRRNTKSYVEIIYDMAGLPYEGEEYVLELSEPAKRFAAKFAKKHGLAKYRFVIGLNTGCGTVFATKRWTVEGFAELIEDLSRETGVRLLLLGGPLERDFNRKIAKAVGRKVLDTGCNNSLDEFLAIIECCDLVVSADSLAMHLAIGRRKQVVALFGPTCAQEVDLFGRGEKIVTNFPCAPCYRSECDKSPTCMEALRAETVAAAVRRRLAHVEK